ncbi:MAG TPA: tetratricopeptide repeat protein [Sandaracinaceae bacterium LLY-WYZ-13_1]|nr:tetratricopeptide repeat protein [Sandaracinaceae bacterium LLY-WYZ-13_1]
MARGLLVIGALALLSTPADAQRPGPVDRWLERAARAAERGHDRRARRILGRALRRADDGDPRPAVALARLLPTSPEAVRAPDEALRARAAEAEEALSSALAEAPHHTPTEEAERLRAWALATGGDHVAAVERAAASAGLQDRAGAALLRRLATVSVLRADLSSARRALAAAHRAYPQDNEVLTELGAVELALGDAEAAVGRFERVLGRRPDDLDARRDLAGALVAAGRAAGAVALLARALEAHPDRVDLRLELAHAALEAGDPDRAIRAARAALAALPDDDGRAHAALGAALAAAGRRDAAQRAFEEALRRDPADARARQGLAALREPPSDEPAPSEPLASPRVEPREARPR